MGQFFAITLNLLALASHRICLVNYAKLSANGKIMR